LKDCGVPVWLAQQMAPEVQAWYARRISASKRVGGKARAERAGTAGRTKRKPAFIHVTPEQLAEMQAKAATGMTPRR
jgi:hypothetical protein